MIEVSEIFQWYRDLPKTPNNLTTIQKVDWEKNHSSFFKKSFVDSKLLNCKSEILDIDNEKLTAYACYNLDYCVAIDGDQYHYQKNTKRREYAQIRYEVVYQNSSFNEAVKSIHVGEMVELEGIIKNVIFRESFGDEFENHPNLMTIQLSLTSIKRIEKQFLHAELLDINLRYKNSFRMKDHCFIATACYGDYNAIEVLILRKFRDDVLLKSKLGSILVSFYYLVSPPIAWLLGKSEPLREFFRKNILTPIILKITQNQ